MSLNLYIHIPWCARKCLYCDFNSYKLHNKIPEDNYLQALLYDLEDSMQNYPIKNLQTIFIGGGTPSLLSGKFIGKLLELINKHLPFDKNIEITLEANPGTIEQKRFIDYYKAGVNRLSLGVQSFCNDKLKALGRIHNANDAKNAIHTAHKAGFDNINIDIMFGLPNQDIRNALMDLEEAIKYSPPHLSWYQLTIEENTPFYETSLDLPNENDICEIQKTGNQLLKHYGYHHYEISAYCLPNHHCKHNLNYWQFGDYLGIGAGAHSKLTLNNKIIRIIKHENAYNYLSNKNKVSKEHYVEKEDLILEFMLNSLRLIDGVSIDLFLKRTNLPISVISKTIKKAITQGFLEDKPDTLKLTDFGQLFLNDCLELFVQ